MLGHFLRDGFSLLRLFSLHFGSFECFSFCRRFGFGLRLGFSLFFGNLGEFFLLLLFIGFSHSRQARLLRDVFGLLCLTIGFFLRLQSRFGLFFGHFGLSPALFGFLEIKLGSFDDFFFFGRFGVVLDGARLDGVNRFVRFGDHSAGVLDSHDDE